MKNSLMSLKIILFNSFSWFIPNCCMCELPPNNWPKNRSKNWIKNHPKNPPKDRIKNRSKIRPKNYSNNCPKDRRVLQGPVGPHNLGAQQLRWSLKAEKNQNVQLFRVLGLDQTGHMSFLTGQDRTPNFAGQVLPDRTESGLLFLNHFTGDISSQKISSQYTNLV